MRRSPFDPQEDEPDDMYADGSIEDQYRADLAALEAIETKNRRAALVIIDIQDKGPLYGYLRDRRIEAVNAMMDLLDVDPRDAVEIAKLQAIVENWTNATDWMKARLNDAQDANLEREEIKGDGEEDPHI